MTSLKKHPQPSRVHPEDEFKIGSIEKAVDEKLAEWRSAGFLRKLWAKDPTLWASPPAPDIVNRLGWLDLPELMRDQLAAIRAFAEEIKTQGFTQVVVLGMGGSSLAPDVFQKTLGSKPGYPKLLVFDSTHPASVAALEKSIDKSRTLFLVSSKSGTTVEPLSLFRYFWAKLGRQTDSPGERFAAITDPGTPLAALAEERKFRRVFLAQPNVGGRFSALTFFGLVPAALIGADISLLLDRARSSATANGPQASEEGAPGLRLGAALAELGKARDKLTILTTASLHGFPDWLEQLLAESLGKDGKGILPIVDEPLASADSYPEDRAFVALLMEGDPDPGLANHLASLEEEGQPLIRLRFADVWDVGREMFRWETAAAAAGAGLGVQPFDQPDVELAKDLARKAMAESGPKNSEAPAEEETIDAEASDLAQAVSRWLAESRPKDYVAIQAYLHSDEETARSLRDLRRALLKKTKLATTLGFGPRFLHSTGQFHKGGPNEGLFLQVFDEPAADLAVPETDYTFGGLVRSQALGDARALRQKGRRLLRVNLKRDVAGGLEKLRRAI